MTARLLLDYSTGYGLMGMPESLAVLRVQALEAGQVGIECAVCVCDWSKVKSKLAEAFDAKPLKL